MPGRLAARMHRIATDRARRAGDSAGGRFCLVAEAIVQIDDRRTARGRLPATFRDLGREIGKRALSVRRCLAAWRGTFFWRSSANCSERAQNEIRAMTISRSQELRRRPFVTPCAGACHADTVSECGSSVGRHRVRRSTSGAASVAAQHESGSLRSLVRQPRIGVGHDGSILAGLTAIALLATAAAAQTGTYYAERGHWIVHLGSARLRAGNRPPQEFNYAPYNALQS